MDSLTKNTMLHKGLIIREPWITLILQGKKTWEMRSRHTKVRGRIALIRAGSGLILGDAELVDCRARQTRADLLEYFNKHRISANQLDKAIEAGWNIPWVLECIRQYESPIPYKHPQGAVVWVNLA